MTACDGSPSEETIAVSHAHSHASHSLTHESGLVRNAPASMAAGPRGTPGSASPFGPATFCAALLVAGFCLPWVTLFGGFVELPGYRIPDAIKAFAQFAAMGDRTPDPRFFLVYLLYLIPIMGIVTIVKTLGQRNARLIGMMTGTLPVVGIGYLVAAAGVDVLHALGYGAYLTIFGGIGLILTSALSPRGDGLP